MDGNGQRMMKRRLCHCLKLNSIKSIRFRRYVDVQLVNEDADGGRSNSGRLVDG